MKFFNSIILHYRNTVVAGITPLDFDHTSLLGNTLEAIAWNKSGIMKAGCISFTVKQPEDVLNVFRERSKEKKVSFLFNTYICIVYFNSIMNIVSNFKCTLKILDKSCYQSEENGNVPLHIQETNASLAIAITEAFIQKGICAIVKF